MSNFMAHYSLVRLHVQEVLAGSAHVNGVFVRLGSDLCLLCPRLEQDRFGLQTLLHSNVGQLQGAQRMTRVSSFAEPKLFHAIHH